MNFKKAEAELSEFEKFIKKKYQPTIPKMESGGLSGEYEGSTKKIFVGQVTARCKDSPSGKNHADYIEPSIWENGSYFLFWRSYKIFFN